MTTIAVIPLALGSLGLLAALAGLVLIWRGWRGRRVGKAPTCRRCNYDLSGNDDLLGSGPAEGVASDAPSTCPECGADLGRADAIASGAMRRSGRRTLAGFITVIVGFGAAGAIFGPQVARSNPLTYVPTRILLVCERVGNDAWRFELADRVARAQVSERAAATLVDRLLEQFAMHNENDRRLGILAGTSIARGELAILEGAFDGGAMSDEQVGRWIELLMSDRLSVSIEPMRPGPILADTTVMVEVSQSSPPMSGRPVTSGGLALSLNVRVDRLVGSTLDAPVEIGQVARVAVRGSSSSGRSWKANLPAGKHALVAECRVSVRRTEPEAPGVTPLGSRTPRALRRSADAESPPLAEWPLRLPLNVEIIGPDAIEMRPIVDPELRDAVRAAIEILSGEEALAAMFSGGSVEHDADLLRARKAHQARAGIVMITVAPSIPVEICMDVLIDDGEHEHRVQLLCPSVGMAPVVVPTSFVLRGARQRGDRGVDIILRPNLDKARELIGTTAIWNEAIVFKNVVIPAE